MTNELATVTDGNSLTAQMDYSRAVSTASMLPDNYRGKPADIMLAVGLGQSMGLSPAESLYRISVIKGKPTASAELIAANVRKAGHRLRVTGDDTSATAVIIRADDPEFPFEVTRDIKWAQAMGLADNPNYRKQPGTMLQWRAITAVARLACPEALYGVAYTSDEIGDFPTTAPQQSGLAAALTNVTAERVTDEEWEQARADYFPETDTPDESPLLNTSSKLARAMFAAFNDLGLTERDDRLKYVSDVVGREVTSSSDMTEEDAHCVIRAITSDLDR